jgi:uncharacterized membrane protein YjgN (DUF898 family)
MTENFTTQQQSDATLIASTETSQASARRISLRYCGSTQEYYRIWVVCHLLTLCTLGLYGPWARARKIQYIANHWLLDGEPFEARLNPLALLKGRLFLVGIYVMLAVITFVEPLASPFVFLGMFLFLPRIVVNSFAFRWGTLFHRGIRFGATPDTTPIRKPSAIFAFMWSLSLIPTVILGQIFKSEISLKVVQGLVIFSALLLLPVLTSALTHARFSQAHWGKTQFSLSITKMDLFRQTIAAFFNFRVIGLVFLTVIVAGSGLALGNIDLLTFGPSVSFALLTVFSVSLGRTRRVNLVLNNLQIGGITFKSAMNPAQQSWMLLRYAILVGLSLGLMTPWVTTRINQWRAERIDIELSGDWDQFANLSSQSRSSGFADELASFFDVEIGI